MARYYLPNAERKEQKYSLIVILKASSEKQYTSLPKPVTEPSLMTQDREVESRNRGKYCAIIKPVTDHHTQIDNLDLISSDQLLEKCVNYFGGLFFFKFKFF